VEALNRVKNIKFIIIGDFSKDSNRYIYINKDLPFSEKRKIISETYKLIAEKYDINLEIIISSINKFE
jgi:hypothetical protein